MKINEPQIFLEINDLKFIFLVIKYNENLDYKILDSTIVDSEGVLEGKIIDLELSSRIIKHNLNTIEKKINFTFQQITVINTQSDYSCINVSGFKKLRGSQISNEDVSYILNDIKKLIADTEMQKTLVHLFNSKFILDNKILKSMPIGLHGEFYNQNQTLFLVSKNDLKNLKLVLNKCDIDIERVVLRSFVEGIYQIKKNKLEKNFIFISFETNEIKISIFDNLALIFSQTFKFGTDIIKKDISKVCSLSIDFIDNIFKKSDIDFLHQKNSDKYLDHKLFSNNQYRKIRIGLLSDIIQARIKEIINLIYKKNINIQNFKKESKFVYIAFNDKGISSHLNEIFKNNFADGNSVSFLEKPKGDYLDSCLGAAELKGRGWENEALPIIHRKKTIISKIFDNFFG
ncbi:hypothetical protein OAN27_01205 [Pelagibacteraceae bacterium]|nr:hypothetical protein [Pelagibacteraceae bacterium]